MAAPTPASRGPNRASGSPSNDRSRCTAPRAADPRYLPRWGLGTNLADLVRIGRYTEVGAEAAAAAHDAALSNRTFDLAIVGLGMNGHIGLNEPGSPADGGTRIIEMAPSSLGSAGGYGARSAPSGGVTTGLGALRKATEIWLLVRGEHKAAILATVVEGDPTPDVPASLQLDHPGLRVFADAAAASQLTSRGPHDG